MLIKNIGPIAHAWLGNECLPSYKSFNSIANTDEAFVRNKCNDERKHD